ncbi:hypothetical protein DMN91_000858 [Ooceraea biroi]|uniref:Endonuclease/exonuclease/phosphatase domain-containing protein n=1 Tax=Ooceraea biroi TaxID=2015173 RepID=A0A3L8E496_OOCBI|nr:hypothetical protein DMN91_000858 [Ooceraea biroi]
MAAKVLQINLNHSWGAQDLIRHHVLEFSIDICCISELHFVPAGDPSWYSSSNGLAALYWVPTRLRCSGVLVWVTNNFVAVRFGPVTMASVYISPSVSVAVYLNFLDDLRDLVLTTRGELLIYSDFNASSLSWGCWSANRHGELLKELISELDLRLCNVDGSFTCVRARGSSVVDLTLTSPSCSSRLRSWHVLTGVVIIRPPVYHVLPGWPGWWFLLSGSPAWEALSALVPERYGQGIIRRSD